jgi:hypothetical protein
MMLKRKSEERYREEEVKYAKEDSLESDAKTLDPAPVSRTQESLYSRDILLEIFKFNVADRLDFESLSLVSKQIRDVITSKGLINRYLDIEFFSQP